jgi:hypothetical protein
VVGKYDRYARDVMRATFGDRWQEGGQAIFSFGERAGYGQVDGIIDGAIAVEFGVGSPKQIRAALLELVLHPLDGKMLVLVDTPGHSTQSSVVQAGRILRALGSSGVVLRLSYKDSMAGPDITKQIASLISAYIGDHKRRAVRLLDTVEGVAETVPAS